MTENTLSLVRWAGGKRWFLPIFRKLTEQLEFAEYYEPFFGGGAVFFNEAYKHNAHVSDLNVKLMETYKAVQEDPCAVIDLLKILPTGEAGYYEVREKEYSDKFQKAAQFIYLNHYSFNGIYRENKNGKYNVPYGKRNAKYNVERITLISQRLKNAEISSGSFLDIKNKISENDLIFLDPPYAGYDENEKQQFIGYNKDVFSLANQKELLSLIECIKEKKAYFILTNGTARAITNIFDGCGTKQELTRCCVVGGYGARRQRDFGEVLWTNIPCLIKEK